MDIDQELLLNRVLDKYGENMRTSMQPAIRDRFDALTPGARRALVEKQINKVIEDE